MVFRPAQNFAFIFLGLFVISTTAAIPDSGPDAATLFKQAVALAEEGDTQSALDVMEQVRQLRPDNLNVLWNMGVWAADLGDHSHALEIWQHYRKVDPEDWRIRAKLVQSFQALGKTALRDQERAALLELHQQDRASDLAQADKYCREQFTAAGRNIMVFEYFEPSGDRQVFYRFSVMNSTGDEEFWYSLGSYDTTVNIAWELGEVPRDMRLYHIDWYDPQGSHASIAFHKGMPSYEIVRARIIEALEKKLDEKTDLDAKGE